MGRQSQTRLSDLTTTIIRVSKKAERPGKILSQSKVNLRAENPKWDRKWTDTKPSGSLRTGEGEKQAQRQRRNKTAKSQVFNPSQQKMERKTQCLSKHTQFRPPIMPDLLALTFCLCRTVSQYLGTWEDGHCRESPSLKTNSDLFTDANVWSKTQR